MTTIDLRHAENIIARANEQGENFQATIADKRVLLAIAKDCVRKKLEDYICELFDKGYPIKLIADTVGKSESIVTCILSKRAAKECADNMDNCRKIANKLNRMNHNSTHGMIPKDVEADCSNVVRMWIEIYGTEESDI